MPDDLILFPVLNKIPKAPPTKSQLQGLPYILNRNAQALGFFAVNLDPDFGLRKFQVGIDPFEFRTGLRLFQYLRKVLT